MMIPQGDCASCAHWNPNDRRSWKFEDKKEGGSFWLYDQHALSKYEDRDGTCRRYAPKPHEPVTTFTWPETGPEDCCGEFQPDSMTAEVLNVGALAGPTEAPADAPPSYRRSDGLPRKGHA